MPDDRNYRAESFDEEQAREHADAERKKRRAAYLIDCRTLMQSPAQRRALFACIGWRDAFGGGLTTAERVALERGALSGDAAGVLVHRRDGERQRISDIFGDLQDADPGLYAAMVAENLIDDRNRAIPDDGIAGT